MLARVHRVDPLDVAQNQDFAVVVGQLVDARPHGGAGLGTLQQLVGRGAPVGKLLDVVTVFLEAG